VIRVCLAGITGWVGGPLGEAIAAAEDLQLVAAVARSARGQNVASVTVSGSVEDALHAPFEVFVDFTSAAAVKANVLAAIRGGRHVVIGSSGLADPDFAEIDAAARARPRPRPTQTAPDLYADVPLGEARDALQKWGDELAAILEPASGLGRALPEALGQGHLAVDLPQTLPL
jgi:dihydrodipicolinate reductase-like protein